MIDISSHTGVHIRIILKADQRVIGINGFYIGNICSVVIDLTCNTKGKCRILI